MLICDNRSALVTHHLVHVYQNKPSIVPVESHRLHMRVNLAPLRRPVSPDLFRPPNKTPLERSRPGHVRRHQGERGVNVPRVEGRVGCAKKFNIQCMLG